MLSAVFLQAIRQTVRILAMDHPQGILRTGDRATVTFEFISRPEFLKEGMKLLFREGKTKVGFPAICISVIGELTLRRRDWGLSRSCYEVTIAWSRWSEP